MPGGVAGGGQCPAMEWAAWMLARSVAVTGRLGASGRPRAEREEARPAGVGEAGPGNRASARTGGRTEAGGEMDGLPGTALQERPGRQTEGGVVSLPCPGCAYCLAARPPLGATPSVAVAAAPRPWRRSVFTDRLLARSCIWKAEQERWTAGPGRL